MNQQQILSQLYDNSPIYFKHENCEGNDLNLEIDLKELELSYVDDNDFHMYIGSTNLIKNNKKMAMTSDIDICNKIHIKFDIKEHSCISYISPKYKFIAEITENNNHNDNNNRLIKSSLKLVTYLICKIGIYSKSYIKCDTYYSNF
jgi:uncharacterized protein (DUF1330 family)